jgi:acyl-CoA hydrolase
MGFFDAPQEECMSLRPTLRSGLSKILSPIGESPAVLGSEASTNRAIDALSPGLRQLRSRPARDKFSQIAIPSRPDFDLPPRDSTRMQDPAAQDVETLTHRLVLPRDANHHGTLYAGTLLALALEAGYATAFRAAGLNANLLLKRVLDLRCYEPVPVGQVVQIRGRQIYRGSAQIVVALWGTPLSDSSMPWMDAVMQFVQVDETGRPEPLDEEPTDDLVCLDPPWSTLHDRTRKLLHIRQ